MQLRPDVFRLTIPRLWTLIFSDPDIAPTLGLDARALIQWRIMMPARFRSGDPLGLLAGSSQVRLDVPGGVGSTTPSRNFSRNVPLISCTHELKLTFISRCNCRYGPTVGGNVASDNTEKPRS